jgi:hypothetical protein
VGDNNEVRYVQTFYGFAWVKEALPQGFRARVVAGDYFGRNKRDAEP